MLVPLALAAGAATLIQALSSFSLSQVLGVAAQRAITDMRKSVQEHIARLPISFSLCRIYARDHGHDGDLALALDRLLQGQGDDRTNM